MRIGVADKAQGYAPPFARFVRIGAIAALPCLLAACSERGSEDIGVKLGESGFGETIPIETLKLLAQPFEEIFNVPGLIEAEEEVTLSAEVAARITKIMYDVGDHIEKGDLLVSLDDVEIRARVNKIEAQIRRVETQLASAKKDLARENELFEKNAAAERSVDDATLLVDTFRADLGVQEAELAVAQVDLDRSSIKAPISGTVAEKYSAEGEYVTPGTMLFDIVMSDQVEFVFSLGEHDVTRVAVGDPIAVKIDAFEDRKLEGKIKLIAPRGRARTRTFRVEVTLDNSEAPPLRPGMAGSARIIRERFDDVYLIPEESILRSGARNYVYMTDGESVFQEDVEIVSAIGAKAVISTSLDAAAELIILGQYALQPESKVRVRRVHEEIPEVQFD